MTIAIIDPPPLQHKRPSRRRHDPTGSGPTKKLRHGVSKVLHGRVWILGIEYDVYLVTFPGGISHLGDLGIHLSSAWLCTRMKKQGQKHVN